MESTLYTFTFNTVCTTVRFTLCIMYSFYRKVVYNPLRLMGTKVGVIGGVARRAGFSLSTVCNTRNADKVAGRSPCSYAISGERYALDDEDSLLGWDAVVGRACCGAA